MTRTGHAFAVAILPALLAMSVAGCFSSPETGREYPVYRLGRRPTIDGIVAGDSAWAKIPVEKAFVTPFIPELETRLPAYKQTSFKIAYDDEYLYVAVLAKEPWTRYMAARPDPDSPFEMDDGVQLLFNPEKGGEVYHFKVNATGPRWSGIGGDEPTSLDDWEARVNVTDTGYVVEVRLPLAKLGAAPASGDVWYGNIVRNTVTITSLEDLVSSWSPIHTAINDPASFSRLVFKSEILTDDQVREIEDRLASESDEIMLLEQAFLEKDQLREDALAAKYQEKLAERSVGLTGVTTGPADLTAPPSAPEDEVWRYGVGFPIQIGPTQAALMANIRMIGSGNIDFEIGTDVIVFDDLDDITAESAIPISRYERRVDPEHGDIIVRKGPVIAGFVPYGALRDDGSPHPHAGTGFGIGWAISHEIDKNGKFEYTEFIERYAMQYQFAYDGDQFRVLEEKRIDASTLVPDWNIVGNFVTSGIPDGDDLLYVMVARENGV
ncbi:MAG: sugar-binding protein, partial [Rhodothermia bacterium]